MAGLLGIADDPTAPAEVKVSATVRRNNAKKEATAILVAALRRFDTGGNLSDAEYAAMKMLSAGGKRTNRYGEPVFYQIFGASPKEGDFVTLRDVVEQQHRGFDWMASNIRKWATKGTAIVRKEDNETNMMETKYIVERLL